MEDRPILLQDIRVPIFAVATVTDHVAPSRSVFKIHLLTDATIDFVLTSGGHNARIVSEPGHPGRVYQSARRPGDGRYIDPDTWRAAAPSVEGSWWPAWIKWLGDNSSPPIDPPGMGAPERGLPPLADAPGALCLCAVTNLTQVKAVSGQARNNAVNEGAHPSA